MAGAQQETTDVWMRMVAMGRRNAAYYVSFYLCMFT
jgi:hypothetical protein